MPRYVWQWRGPACQLLLPTNSASCRSQMRRGCTEESAAPHAPHAGWGGCMHAVRRRCFKSCCSHMFPDAPGMHRAARGSGTARELSLPYASCRSQMLPATSICIEDAARSLLSPVGLWHGHAKRPCRRSDLQGPTQPASVRAACDMGPSPAAGVVYVPLVGGASGPWGLRQ